MIIMGYPCIGKAAIAKEDYRFINLNADDSLLKNGIGKKKWVDSYVNLALYLSKQGYFVFVTTHPEVRKKVIAKEKAALLVYPDLGLKGAWIERATKRYHDRPCHETHNAWAHIKENYDSDFLEMEGEKCRRIVLHSTNYNLKKEIIDFYDYLRGNANG